MDPGRNAGMAIVYNVTDIIRLRCIICEEFVNHFLQELTVMNDTVLETHEVDPALVQMTFLDDGKLQCL